MGLGLGVHIPLAIFLMALFCAVLALAGRPRYAAFFLILLIPLQTTRDRLQAFPLGAQIIDVLWISILLGLFLRGALLTFPRSPMYRWLGALALFTYVSLWVGSFYLSIDLPLLPWDPRFSDWKNYMVMPLICIAVAGSLRNRDDLKIALGCMAVGVAVVDWSFFRSISGRDFSHFAYALRDAGVLGYAGVNGFAAFIAQSIVFFAVLLFCYRKKLPFLGLLALIGFSIYCLLFSFSRGAYFAVLVGLAFAALFRMRIVLVAIAILVLTWQVVLPGAVQERINMTYSGEGDSLEPSAGDRVLLWEDAMTLYAANPVIGTGLDTYSSLHRVADYRDTHNYYVKAMVETGTLGLLLLIGLLGRMFWLGMQLYFRESDPLLRGMGLAFASMVVCCAVANIFGDRWTYLPVDGYLWVLLGCVMRALTVSVDSRESLRSVRLNRPLTAAPQPEFVTALAIPSRAN